jgi:hypothetical protein
MSYEAQADICTALSMSCKKRLSETVFPPRLYLRAHLAYEQVCDRVLER